MRPHPPIAQTHNPGEPKKQREGRAPSRPSDVGCRLSPVEREGACPHAPQNGRDGARPSLCLLSNAEAQRRRGKSGRDGLRPVRMAAVGCRTSPVELEGACPHAPQNGCDGARPFSPFLRFCTIRGCARPPQISPCSPNRGVLYCFCSQGSTTDIDYATGVALEICRRASETFAMVCGLKRELVALTSATKIKAA